MLIRMNGHIWDANELTKLSRGGVELNAILDTVIGDPANRDRLVWPFDKRGRFTVKSGYH